MRHAGCWPRVSGRRPPARRETKYKPMKSGSRPRHTSGRSATAHAGVDEKLNLRQVSAGAPVIAQMGGKSLAASCADQTWTLAGSLGT